MSFNCVYTYMFEKELVGWETPLCHLIVYTHTKLAADYF